MAERFRAVRAGRVLAVDTGGFERLNKAQY
jgi:hypothetical protein